MPDNPSKPSAAGAALFKKPGVWIAASLLLSSTFWLYLQPDLVIMLADQLWSCF